MKLARYALMFITTAAMAGCASTADQLAPMSTFDLQGSDAKTLQAPADGQVSVYDVSDDKLLYSGSMRKGQMLVIDPVAKNVIVNGMVANSKPLYGGDALKIQFDENK